MSMNFGNRNGLKGFSGANKSNRNWFVLKSWRLGVLLILVAWLLAGIVPSIWLAFKKMMPPKDPHPLLAITAPASGSGSAAAPTAAKAPTAATAVMGTAVPSGVARITPTPVSPCPGGTLVVEAKGGNAVTCMTVRNPGAVIDVKKPNWSRKWKRKVQESEADSNDPVTKYKDSNVNER